MEGTHITLGATVLVKYASLAGNFRGGLQKEQKLLQIQALLQAKQKSEVE